MSRVPFPDPPAAHVAKVLSRLPDLAIFRMIGHADSAFIPWLRFGAVLLEPGGFDPRLREIAILRVARLTPGADYEWTQHAAIARQTGVSDDLLAALESEDDSPFDADARLVLALTEQVVRDAAPDDETLAAFLDRFSPAELIHLVLVIGQYMMVGRVMATTGLLPEPAIGLDALRPS